MSSTLAAPPAVTPPLGVVGARGEGGRGRGDDGRITILVLGYFVVVALVVSVVAGIAGVQTQRQRLFAVADAAAVDASDALADPRYYVDGVGEVVPLDDASVRTSVETYLDETGAGGRFRDLAVLPGTGSGDGATARVVLTAVARPPLVGWLTDAVVGGVPITVTARARATVDPG